MTLGVLLALGVDSVFRKSFNRLETEWVAESVRRLEAAVAAEVEGVERSAKDYATWTDTYEYLRDSKPAYIENNLLPATFTNLQIDAFLLFDLHGTLHSGRSYDAAGIAESGVAEMAVTLKAPAGRVEHEGREAGIVKIGERIALFALLPVLRDDESGPANGVLGQIRFLSADRIERLRRTVNLNLSLEVTPASAATPTRTTAVAGQSYVTEKRDDRLIIAHVPMTDASGMRVATWHVRLGRQIHLQGIKARVVFYSVMCVLVGAAALLIGWMLRSLVIARLEALHQAVDKVGATSDLTVRIPVRGFDELAGLARGINQMLAAISHAEQERVAAEHEKERLNEQLQQAQKLEAIGTLTGGLAHDFNNLLTSIQGSTTLLRLEGCTDEAGEPHLRRIEQASAQAATLVRQMMAFGRRTPSVFTQVHLGDVARDALHLLRSSVPRGVTFQFRNEAVNDLVYGDAAQLQQVLVNLATNASHAMAGAAGSLSLQISEVRLPIAGRPETAALRSGDYLQLKVSDTGCGIPPEHLPRIFEPFYTTKPVGSGTGLGLAVVHGIITHHHGSIGVDSAVGQGTTFFIYLPQVLPDPEVANDRTRARPRQAIQDRVRLLLVDDDAMVRETVEAGLRRVGYEVTTASGSVQALASIHANADFNVVVTDQMMPGMTGTELGALLAKEYPSLPLVLLTGYASAMNETKVKELGFSAMLMKPISMELLDRTLRTVCSKSVD